MSQVVVATYPTRAEAQAVASMLTDAGLDAVVIGDDAGGAIPHLTIGTRGPSICVPVGQEDEASDLLDVDLRHDSDQRLAEPQVQHPPSGRRLWLRVAGVLALAVIVIGIAFSIVLS